MAMELIDDVLITQFADMAHIKAQQIKSRLRPHVQIIPMRGDVFAYDGLGNNLEAREVTGRFIPSIFDDIEFWRRKISKRRFVVTVPIDKDDVEGLLTNPEGRLATAVVRAMERVFDRVCVSALFADVQTGREFTSTVTFAADGGFTVNATTGFTYDKLLEIKQNFIDADVGTDMPTDVILGISGDEHTDLMGELELVSGDFSRQMVVDKGEMTTAMGMQIIKFAANARNPILSVSSGTRDCFALATGGLAVGLSRDWEITVKDRADLVNVRQIQATTVLGAVRTEGVLVQKVQTTD